MTRSNQDKNKLSKTAKIDGLHLPSEDSAAHYSFQATSNLKQLTNIKEALHWETIGLLEDELFKKLSKERNQPI